MDCSGRTRDVGSGGLAELARIKPRAKAMKIRSLISSDLNRVSYREHIIDDILPFGFFEMNLNGHVLGVYPDDDWSQKQIDELGISEPIKKGGSSQLFNIKKGGSSQLFNETFLNTLNNKYFNLSPC